MENHQLTTTSHPQRLALGASGLSIFDSGTFEQMGLIASKLACSSLIPSSLRGASKEETAANCFRVVEQAQRWGLSPFAVLDSASVVHGKLMWEGKLIHAAITASLGVRLKFEYAGEGDSRKVTVSGTIDGEVLTIDGTVADWKTTGKGSPWENLANRDQMLAYRGARQWARRHAPEVILGVYAPDEFEEGIKNVAPAFVRTEPINPFARQTKDNLEAAPAPASPKDASKASAEAELTLSEDEEGEPLRRAYDVRAYVVNVDEGGGIKKDGTPWTRYRVTLSYNDAQVVATTFSHRLGRRAERERGNLVLVRLQKEERGIKLLDLQLKEEGALI